jgi:hypothetical protein
VFLQFAFPTLKYFFLTSDVVLARGVIGGLGGKGITEGEKDDFDRVINMIDPDRDNILTQKTADPEREATRKAIAPVG